MDNIEKFHNIKNVFLFCIFFLLLTFFFSVNKFYIPALISLIFLFSKKEIKKILFINLLIFSILFKFVALNLGSKNTLSELIYEKHFLYGVQNLDDEFIKQSGDLTGFIDLKIDDSNEKINIKTDEYGFRNDNFNEEYQYIFVGDSFLHQHRLDQKDLINYRLNNYGIRAYNAGIAIYDMSHYFEIIKFFKDKKNFDKKFVMFVYPGNDFINYGDPKNNYHKFFDNFFLQSYIKLRKFFDFHSKIKFLVNLIKKEDNYEDKVSSYTINNKEMYFFNDFINSDLSQISFNQKFTETYKDYLPDLLVIIPTKFDVYCNFIEKSLCRKKNYKSKIISNRLFSNVEVVDSTQFLIKKAEQELINDNFIYDLKDTHLNSLGNKYLSEFFYEKSNQ